MNAVEKTEKLLRTEVDIGLLDPNPSNPNKMTDGEFNRLCDSMSKSGWLDAAVVVKNGERFRIVGGHHRVEAGKVLGFKKAPVVIITDPTFNEDEETFLLVKHNVISGKLSPKLFVDLYKKMAEKYPDEVLAENFGFADRAEFDKLIAKTKAGLPKELKDKFAKAAKDLKTIDDLEKLINRLFTEYGNTLKFNYMVFDYQGKESVWVRCQQADLKHLYALGDVCHKAGVTLDSALALLVKRAATSPELQEAIGKLPKNAEPVVTGALPLLDPLNQK